MEPNSSPTSAWLSLLLTKTENVESNPGPTTQTNTHPHSLQSFGLVTFVTTKQQTSIRCTHTHWIHRKYTQIRQYKPDWRCTIHTNRNNNASPSPTKHHPPTHKQHSTKGQEHRHTSNQQCQKQNRGTINLVHSTQPDITIQETKLTQN